MNPTVKISIVGAESSGKSTLAVALATHFKAPLVEEYAREYLEAKDEPRYELADLNHIAKEQVRQVHETLKTAPKILFCDTDLVTLHIWALDKFDKAIPFVEENLEKEKSDLYLLCKPDLLWQPDPLREDSNRREELYNWNLWVLREMNAEFAEIEGQQETRLNNAIAAIDKFLDQ